MQVNLLQVPMRARIALVAWVLVLLAISQSGSALRVSIDPFDGAIPPGSSPHVTDITVRVDCAISALDTRVREVTLAVDALPEWTRASIHPRTFSMSTSDCLSRNERKAVLSVETLDATRAFLAGTVGVTARETRDSSDLFDRATVGVIAGYQGKLSARLIAPFAVGGGFTVPGTVENLGNAPTRVDIAMIAQDTSWRVVAPRFIVLDSDPGGTFPRSSSFEVGVSAHTEGAFVAPGRLLVALTPHYLGGQGVGDTVVMAVDIQSAVPRATPATQEGESPSAFPLLFALVGGVAGHAIRASRAPPWR